MLKTLVNGGDEEDRTPDLLNAIQTRSQLRHAPMMDIYLCLPACLFAVDSSSFLLMIGIQLFVGCRFYQFREIVKSAEIFCENPVCRFAEDCAFNSVKRPLECHSSALPGELHPQFRDKTYYTQNRPVLQELSGKKTCLEPPKVTVHR